MAPDDVEEYLKSRGDWPREIAHSAEAMIALERVRALVVETHKKAVFDYQAAQQKTDDLYQALVDIDQTLTFLRKVKD